jgi:KUP system potassium uptake protein
MEGKDLFFDPDRVTYFLSREHTIASRLRGVLLWRANLFALMARNALPATTHFHLPDNQIIEIGTRFDL